MKNKTLPLNQRDIIEQISAPPSKVNTLMITNYILKNPSVLDILYQIIWTSPDKVQWKASWVLENVFLERPELVYPYFEDMIKRFDTIKSDGVKRHVSKILSLSNITQQFNGHFINTCFDWLMSEIIPVAVKVYCMQILFNITTEYPDLKQELKAVIEEQIPNNSAGFKSRASKLIIKL